MIEPKITALFFNPNQQFVEAKIVSLTPELIDEQIHNGWWNDGCLADNFEPEIDQHWNWNEMVLEYEGRVLASEKVAITSGIEDAVRGAMLISVDVTESILEPTAGSLFVELLFTAPRNRPKLRRDGRPWLRGVGTELLTWGAWFSREKGCDGRLRLDASPEFVDWYGKRGLQKLGLESIVYEGVEYTPMELPVSAALKLLDDW